MNRFLTAAALIALPLTAATAQMGAPMPAKTYVMKAGAGDLYEIQSSKLVMTSADPKLKAFASMMVKDHTQSTADVKAAAMAANMHPAPPKLDAMQMRDIAALRAAKGSARDRLYVTQQKAAHDKALALQQGYASDGTVPSLKMAAEKIVPVVQTHITELQSM